MTVQPPVRRNGHTNGHPITANDVVVDHSVSSGVVRALDCAEFAVDAGSSVAVMGPSGCGKSTLLGLLAGLATPTSGTIAVGPVQIQTLSETERVRFRRRTIGMVYQADNLLPHLTVEENVGLQLGIARSGRNRDRPNGSAAAIDISQLLTRLGIGALADRLPDQLSGGQRQRVAIARAIVHQPQIILADEPTGALDDDAAAAVAELLIETHRRIGATMVIVTHDPSIAAYADRTVQLMAPRLDAEIR